jgi:hypothetical protein
VIPELVLYCFATPLHLKFALILPLFPEYRSLPSKKVNFAGLSALLFAEFAYHATVETGRTLRLLIALATPKSLIIY